ncbi:bifunctional 4-hydroxy-2-oxoglutarate aldolase/2-dehydro-3-deoxy-phosphogluconate aldolase [Candidatus Bipolaricaulota bacterium]|nr:bifunctional 4-hydroxy-2-oxoglutarate aldolase/2-dehydro-3-deoxy-phosphogluconate aldolase [Candidatus Bipolaricaulota bacterium]
MDNDVIARLLKEMIVAVVRLQSENDGLPVARALMKGGVRVIEMTLTTPGATELIKTVREELPSALVGAGSVLSRKDVDRCIDAGAEFLVSPILDEDVMQYALSKGIPFSPGTFTPTEAYNAWKLGAGLVKVFPAARLGPKLLSDLKAPMPFLRLMPTGGISADTINEFLMAGADVVGAGSWLIEKSAVAAKEFGRITDRAAQLRERADQFAAKVGR